jgi:triosephosphate isomerase (TIM)
MLKNKKLIIGNWKMSPATLAEAKKLVGNVTKTAVKLKKTAVVLAPSFVHISSFSTKKSKISWGAQDVCVKSEGSFTGEVSVKMLKDLHVEFVIIGHSERRVMGETNDLIAKKVVTTLAEGLKPVLCIGETVRDTDGEYLNEIKTQLLECIAQVKRGDMLDLVIAYEPVSAIGALEALNSHDIHTSVLFIRKILAEHFSKDLALSAMILYGGSVNLDNASDIIKNGGVDGLLIGRASLNGEFNELLKTVEKA